MGSRDHSITCETCGLQRGGMNDLKCACDDHSITCDMCGLQRGGMNGLKCRCDDERTLVATATFDKQAALDAVKAFDAGQLSALAVAGHLPSAIDRIEALEDSCRGCLRMIDGIEQPSVSLQAIAAVLRSGLTRNFMERDP